MELQMRTTQFMERFRGLCWFAHVGEPINNSGVGRIATWEELRKRYRDRDWDNITNELQNLLTVRLSALFSDDYQSWNQRVVLLRPFEEDLLRKPLMRFVDDGLFDIKVVYAIEWIVGTAAMEQEFADLVPPGLATEWSEWFLRGHFPCGWEGDFEDFPENGRLIVF